ncbi:MAG TPA: hypothetical protein VF129_14250 [Actinomycetota bacterium]
MHGDDEPEGGDVAQPEEPAEQPVQQPAGDYPREETLYIGETQWGPPSNWNPMRNWD